MPKNKKGRRKTIKGESSVTYKCIRSKAQIELIQGEKSIKTLILK